MFHIYPSDSKAHTPTPTPTPTHSGRAYEDHYYDNSSMNGQVKITDANGTSSDDYFLND